ncbi:MAG: peptide/nickel transport system permease protein [Solirubrobacteraceae bacterium]|jgi:peptide/nickel transport system permease protein|nr:peptide/nickel transport system permease protein [Solirubrobacteraceae bacterium]
MGPYIIRRLLYMIVVLIFVVAITFLIFYVLPTADPAALRAGRSPTPETLAAIREQLGLDKSLPEQFWLYLKDLVLHFDFGNSFVNNVEVRSLILDRLPNTLFLISGAAVLWFGGGVLIGTISAIKRGTILDRAAMGTALVAISAPVYWLGLVSLYLFASDIGRFPLFPGNGAYQQAHGFFAKIPTLILPWIVLAAAFAAIYARLTRSNLLEVMSEDYVRTARAKGLTERRVVVRHGLRAAITPVVTVLGLDLGILVGGAILTESVFGIPGIGRLSFDAIQRGDLVTIQGTTLFLAFAVVLMNLVVDILYAFLDPRVRY